MSWHHVLGLAALALERIGVRAGRAESVSRFQMRGLRRLAGYAARFSPYYAELFDQSGLRPRDFRSLDDLSRLPTLSPEILRDSAARMLSSEVDPSRCFTLITSGTTGDRVRIPTTPWELAFDAALLVRGYARHGVRFWHRQAKVALARRIPSSPRLLQRLGFFRREYIAITEPPDRKIAWLRRLKPDVLMCWASTLNEISQYLEEKDEYLCIPRVFSSSDTLTPDIRRLAERRLNTRITDWYGAIETGPVGWQCSGGTFHIGGPWVIVELLDDDNRRSSRGRIVCTPLWRYALPIFRYELGDHAEWAPGPCPCGNAAPGLRNLRGRDLDLIRWQPGGSRVVPTAVPAVMYETPGVRQFQFVQEAADRYMLRVVAGPEFSEAVEQRLEAHFRKHFGSMLQVRLVKAAAIRQPPGFKYMPVITQERLERIRAEGGDPRVFFES